MSSERFFARREFVKTKSMREMGSAIDQRKIIEWRGLRDSAWWCVRRAGRAPPLQRQERLFHHGKELLLHYGAGAAGGAVDGFDQGDGFAAFGAVADWLAVCANRMQEIFEDFLVAANVGDGG
jgi:hypothetical protein